MARSDEVDRSMMRARPTTDDTTSKQQSLSNGDRDWRMRPFWAQAAGPDASIDPTGTNREARRQPCSRRRCWRVLPPPIRPNSRRPPCWPTKKRSIEEGGREKTADARSSRTRGGSFHGLGKEGA